MEFSISNHKNMELSTQLVIVEAERRGHKVAVLDEADNIIRITGNGKVEYIKQATRTSADSYIAPLLMENKNVTKIILNEVGINVPEGKIYRSPEDAERDWPLWKDVSCVIKPNSTNFGTAVAMMKAPFNREEYLTAVKSALDADDSFIIEKMITGNEYRFLVIGSKVRAVLHRVPAHVTGDGSRNIRELVNEKNASPLRGRGYVTPLEKIQLGEEENDFLAKQNLTFDHVPLKGVTVYLRKNSNISTGGDSIDYTDMIHPSYRDIAGAAAAAVGAKICGVDMIVSDYAARANGENYSIIELNFNPALHIHDYPFNGKNREVEKDLLDLLDL
jgi:D-alanine-D-alanine ligase-like ATP-grasp enzyme